MHRNFTTVLKGVGKASNNERFPPITEEASSKVRVVHTAIQTSSVETRAIVSKDSLVGLTHDGVSHQTPTWVLYDAD